MNSFGFIIHPISAKRDISRKFPLLGRLLSERQIHFFSSFFPPIFLSHITGARSLASGREIHGWAVACPFTARRMMELPTRTVYRKIIQSGRMVERLGAQVIGLGAYTSVIGDAGLTVSRHLERPVTTGDSYTVAVAVEALLSAGLSMGKDLPVATAAVLGATGAIGTASALLLAERVNCVILVGRDTSRLQALAHSMRSAPAEIRTATDLAALAEAELVLSSSNAPEALIGPEHLGPGTVVCDIARPRDVKRSVTRLRDDVLVIDGGLVEVPGMINYGFDFGFPAGMTYACMAEAMALAMEGRFESYTLGKRIMPERVREISAIASRHGFRLGGFRSFDRQLTNLDLRRIRERAGEARLVKRGVP